MITNKKVRLVAISVVLILFIILFFRTSSKAEIRPETLDNDTKAQTLLTSNNLIDSKNDDKVDAAINNEISKLNNDEDENDTTGDSKEASKPKTESTEEFNVAQALLEIRAMSPMVIFSKTYCPYSKKLKQLLRDNYQITPEPTIVELDKHEHGQNLQEYLGETTGRRTVPNVLVGSSLESRGGCDDIVKLHEEGMLQNLLNEWGSKKLAVKKIEAPSNS